MGSSANAFQGKNIELGFPKHCFTRLCLERIKVWRILYFPHLLLWYRDILCIHHADAPTTLTTSAIRTRIGFSRSVLLHSTHDSDSNPPLVRSAQCVTLATASCVQIQICRCTLPSWYVVATPYIDVDSLTVHSKIENAELKQQCVPAVVAVRA